MKVLLPTKNKVKIEKWGSLIKELGYDLITLSDLNEQFDEPKEDGETVLENAVKKAEYYYKKTGIVTVTTDSSLYIDGLSKEEQIGLFAGREVIRDGLGNVVSEKKLTDEDNYQRLKTTIKQLGGDVNGYFEEGIIIYYGTGVYESKSFIMNRRFKTPGSPVRKENAPMRSFTYYEGLGKYRSEMTAEEANEIEGKTFEEQRSFFNNALYKASHLSEYNFNMLPKRIEDSNKNSDFEKIKDDLSAIDQPCLCTGSGGSYCTSYFASQVLAAKNHVIAVPCTPRDILYRHDLDLFNNLLAVTYGNNNHGITTALEKAKLNNLKTYILTNNPKTSDDYHALLHYGNTLQKEYSFISMASSFMPMSLLLKYYLNVTDEQLKSIVYDFYQDSQNVKIAEEEITGIEITCGDNTYTAAELLKSAIKEAGLGIPAIHEKYDYFHGASNLAYFAKNKNILIHLVNGDYKEIDQVLLKEASSLFKEVIVLQSNQKDPIVGEFDLAMQSMSLVKKLGDNIGRDISKFEYAPQIKKFYSYKGGL